MKTTFKNNQLVLTVFTDENELKNVTLSDLASDIFNFANKEFTDDVNYLVEQGKEKEFAYYVNETLDGYEDYPDYILSIDLFDLVTDFYCRNYSPKFYTQNGWEGRNYDDRKGAKEVAKELRAYIKSNLKLNACKWSITSKWGMNADFLRVSLMAAPFDPFTEEYKEKHESRYKEGYSEHATVKNYTTPEAYELIMKVKTFVMQYIHDDSDSMIDYFDRNIYDNYEIGKYDKPFQLIENKSHKQNTPSNEPNEPKTVEPVSATLGLEIVAYSEKAIAVFGETKQLKDQLKEIGGRFNPALKYNDGKRAGWIFSKRQTNKVMGLLNPVQ